MIYVLVGTNSLAKDKRIAEIKNKVLDPGSLDFDFETVAGVKCDPDELKKALLALPTRSSKRIVLIRQADKLSTHNRDIILEFAKKKADYLDLILDWFVDSPQEAFLDKIAVYSRRCEDSQAEKPNVFAMTNALSQHDTVSALDILYGLLEEGIHPLQIMGGMVWYWGNIRRRLSLTNFRKGLALLQQADLNIKRSRLQPEFALETLVVKISSLIT